MRWASTARLRPGASPGSLTVLPCARNLAGLVASAEPVPSVYSVCSVGTLSLCASVGDSLSGNRIRGFLENEDSACPAWGGEYVLLSLRHSGQSLPHG
jgi:hypothetical protein